MALVWSRSFNTHIITVKDFNHRSHYCNIYILGWGQKSGNFGHKLQERCSNEMLATSYSQKWHVTWYAVPASMHAAKCYSANFKDTELWMHTLTCTSQFKISVQAHSCWVSWASPLATLHVQVDYNNCCYITCKICCRVLYKWKGAMFVWLCWQPQVTTD